MNECRGLWRGKRVNSGEWVLGCLIRDSSKAMIVVLDKKTNRMSATAVDPSTLGECTGLRDKNGKLIFEGDICKVAGELCVITYKKSAFFADFGNYCPCLNGVTTENFEIIGNIHDNPELLQKGATDDE